jgi:cytochrome c553
MDIKHEMLKCSEIKVNDSRLMCFDVISQMLKPTPKERVRAQFLIKECSACHGARWDIPTIQDSRAVRHMSQTQIHEALLLYQQKKRGSAIMQNQVNQMSDSDIELISKYIVNFISEEIN